MRLIIGGACQGKRRYVAERYGIPLSEMVDASEQSPDALFGQPCIYGFHWFVRNQMRQGNQLDIILECIVKLVDSMPDSIIIMNEIGSGIIPMEREEREWRETVGRVGCLLAERAESVERVVCGCGVRIK